MYDTEECMPTLYAKILSCLPFRSVVRVVAIVCTIITAARGTIDRDVVRRRMTTTVTTTTIAIVIATVAASAVAAATTIHFHTRVWI
jgi:uncharacterized membrane protein YeiH